METMGVKVLVTGASGFIGSNLVKELVRQGYEVYALIRGKRKDLATQLKDIPALHHLDADAFFENVDQGTTPIPKFKVCFHLAAYGVNHSHQGFDELVDGNIKYTMKVLEACKEHGVQKIINTGSCFEYGLNNGVKLSEGDCLTPQTNYAIMKMACESMSILYAQNNQMNLLSVRPFGVYGEGEGFHRLVPQLMKAALLDCTMPMTKGEQVRDYLYVKDVVDAYIALAQAELPPFGIYNISSGQGVTIKDLALEIATVAKSKSTLFEFGVLPYRPNEVMHFVGDHSKLVADTGWTPKYSLQEGLKHTYEWYKANLEVKQ